VHSAGPHQVVRPAQCKGLRDAEHHRPHSLCGDHERQKRRCKKHGEVNETAMPQGECQSETGHHQDTQGRQLTCSKGTQEGHNTGENKEPIRQKQNDRLIPDSPTFHNVLV
jgi:hypothetical protein